MYHKEEESGAVCCSEGVSTLLLAPALLPAVTRLRLDTEKCVGGGVAVCRSPPPEDCPTQRSSPCRDITQGQGQQGHLASSRRGTWDICMRWNGWMWIWMWMGGWPRIVPHTAPLPAETSHRSRGSRDTWPQAGGGHGTSVCDGMGGTSWCTRENRDGNNHIGYERRRISNCMAMTIWTDISSPQ